MKQLSFESAQQAEEHLTKLGGTRVQWLCTSRNWATRDKVFVTMKPWKKPHEKFSTILIR